MGPEAVGTQRASSDPLTCEVLCSDAGSSPDGQRQRVLGLYRRTPGYISCSVCPDGLCWNYSFLHVFSAPRISSSSAPSPTVPPCGEGTPHRWPRLSSTQSPHALLWGLSWPWNTRVQNAPDMTLLSSQSPLPPLGYSFLGFLLFKQVLCPSLPGAPPQDRHRRVTQMPIVFGASLFSAA